MSEHIEDAPGYDAWQKKHKYCEVVIDILEKAQTAKKARLVSLCDCASEYAKNMGRTAAEINMVESELDAIEAHLSRLRKEVCT